jgi:hypothetical protein
MTAAYALSAGVHSCVMKLLFARWRVLWRMVGEEDG